MSVIVKLQCVATGEIRKVNAFETQTLENAEFWWLKGNGACDCNRHIEFLRAAGPGPADDPYYNNAERECGDKQYRALSLSDGEKIIPGDLHCPHCGHWNTCKWSCPGALNSPTE